MRPSEKGVILTERDEFVVLGQANSGEKKWLDDTEAINHSFDALEPTVDEAIDKWMIPASRYIDARAALSEVQVVYGKLKSREDSGSYCENASWGYSRLSHLEYTASNVLEGIFTALGVPSAKKKK